MNKSISKFLHTYMWFCQHWKLSAKPIPIHFNFFVNETLLKPVPYIADSM